MNSYTELKNIFVEGNGVFDYINLDKSTLTYHKIINALKKPLKIILFFGKPGIGKTFLLQKIKSDLSQEQKVILFPHPFFNEKDFIKELCKEIFHTTNDNIESYEDFMEVYKMRSGMQENQLSNSIILLLDEAQLYPNYLVEKIRLFADAGAFKILFTIHKTSQEDLIVKDYFKTRIWESIELKNLSPNDVRIYIEKKFIFHNKHTFFNMFKPEHIKLIHALTNGNLRTINKLMYKIFEIYEHYEHNRPSYVNLKYIRTNIIEMAAIDSELINA